MKRLALATLVVASPAAAQVLVYDFSHTWTCVGQAEAWQDKVACIGISANLCMEDTPGGFSTVGMGSCLDREFQDWDAALNEADGPLRIRYVAQDGEASEHITLTQADALRDMQRAWIDYRDAACDYERSKWQGGTGGGPAAISCMLQMTGEQALKLQSDLNFE